MLQLPLNIQLDDSARLDNFYVGDHQQLLKRLSDLQTCMTDFFLIWGAQQVGKSHLAQGVCYDLSEQGKTAVYIPLDNPSLRPEVLEGLEFADLVCLDALESVVGQADWEEAIFGLFNRLKQSKKSFIIFCRLPLSDLQVKLADLKSRLSSMEIYKLSGIAEDHQTDFIRSIGSHRGLDISVEVARFLITRTQRDVVKLIDMIQLLDQQSLTQQRKITIPFVKQTLSI